MKESTAKSALRVFAILELFQIRQEPLTLKDLVAALEIPTSSAEELLKCLCREGYLCFDTVTRTYMPTPKVTHLGSWVPDAMLMHGRLQECAQRLGMLTGEMIAVATANELFMQNIAFIPPTKVVDIRFSEDRVYPLVTSAMGVVWLSDKDEARIERLYRLSIARGLVDRTNLPLNRLLCRVEAVRGRDVAVIESSQHSSATMVAVAVPVSEARRRVILSIGGPSQRVHGDLSRIKDALAQEREWLLAA
ncbi:IclR family transcriptional regulator [Sphingomonas immobilis]|uniref:Helix-turn-helix domain-containing protein n=1 Tax=Sphingomonas immobilis TaxID=3063997 RepID=A0ABT8ZT99_9SPHN|nr:helix-turn-helix domain-containing protein [Sphingomonas sp. CA1-15]MDO7840790.1 helix-turn-helix domain-containing protein [Sphingomonas sp. CA1-15]